MYERVGTSLTINVGTSNALETDVFIESHRLSVLLIHINRKLRMQRERSLDEHLANSLSMKVGINKQGFQMSAMEEHEADWLVCRINGECQRDLRKER